jgi:glycine C-acetyltransferase
MYEGIKSFCTTELKSIREAGLYKSERVIESPQGAHISVNRAQVLNFCANNYLGLSNSPILREAAQKGLAEFGLGLSSVRFICGTQTIHKQLEEKISQFLGTEDTILYTSCFDANGGLFETLLGEQDAIVSDALNHASIIDGIRLCKAKRFRYDHGDLDQLRTHLKQARFEGVRNIMIATDGVFSMDGHIARLSDICDLADEFEALVMVDDSHATGFFGPTGRGSIEHCDVMDQVDVVTSTLGKALGGSAGGFTSGKKEIIELLRQRSRPYLFSNSLPPALVCATIACLDLLSKSTELRDRLEENTKYFRSKIAAAGFTIKEGVHPIVPIMLGDAKLAVGMAQDMLKEGIYVIGFSYPVVPMGQARIRVQISAAHSRGDLDQAIAAFTKVGKAHGVIG